MTTELQKSEIELKRVTDLIESIEHSHSLFCLKLSTAYIGYMDDKEFSQLLKLMEVYRQDVNLLMGLSNTPYQNKVE